MRNNIPPALLLGFMLMPALLSAGCSIDKGETSKEEEALVIKSENPLVGSSAEIAEGERMFALKCSQCHGPDASGGPEAPDLTDSETDYGANDDDIFRIIYYGTPNGMPTWKDELGKENIWKIVAFLSKAKK